MPPASKFDRADLIGYLRILDARLTRPGTLRLIGGAVVGLCYLPEYRTRDVDFAWADREVEAAIQELRLERPDLVVTSQTGVYFAPYSHEERLRALDIPGLTRLTVEVPERHDLAIMKVARGLDRDLEALVQIHAIDPFDPGTLVERFHETWLTGPQRLADLGLLALIETLFGAAEADRAERRLETLRQAR